MKIKRTLVIQAGGRRMKNQIQKMTSSTTEEYIIQEHQLWEQFVLLDGDEDFMNERSDKRTRVGDMTSDREDDDESDISSGLEDDEQGGRRVSLDVGTVPV